ncbi:MAG TPA: SulP family inorganic anion transporter [Ramlibacter sp.]|nr:SulP family inorganic anion transporter [Ramlibacter sp.]
MSTTAREEPRARPAGAAGLLAALAGASSMAILTLSSLVSLGTLAVGPLGRPAFAAGVAAAAVAAIVGGAFVALRTRIPGQVTAPAASTTVIYAALAADVVLRAGEQASVGSLWASLSLAVVIMGVLLWVAGKMQFADAIKFLPTPVGAGFVTGIGLLVIWTQLGPLLGIEGKLARMAPAAIVEAAQPGALLVGVVAAATIWAYPKLKLPGPPVVAALLAGTALHHALAVAGLGSELGPTLGALAPAADTLNTARSTWAAFSPQWLLGTIVQVLPYAAFLALQAIINAAVTGSAVATLLGTRPRVNDTLRAQGMANIACGLLGALPVTTAATLALPAARQGATSGVLALACAVLLVLTFVLGGVLGYVPVPVLAGILVMSGYGLIDRWAKDLAGQLWRRRGRDPAALLNLALVVAVAAAFFLGSIPLALTVGAVLAMLLLAVNISRATTIGTQDGRRLASTRVWPAGDAAWLAERRACIALLRPRGGLFFGTADELARHLEALADPTRYCIVDVAKAATIDATGCQILAGTAKTLAARGVHVLVAGVAPASAAQRELETLGLALPRKQAAWFADVDHALEAIEEEMLAERTAADADATLDRAASPLTLGMDDEAIARFRQLLLPRDVAGGALFRRGEEASSMFLLESGRVEICVTNAETGRTTRLASFGPGAIFGEVSLLSTGQRTADAVCVEPCRLHEFTREALGQLEASDATLHARILRNLGIHLANRLVIATSTLQAQQ